MSTPVAIQNLHVGDEAELQVAPGSTDTKTLKLVKKLRLPNGTYELRWEDEKGNTAWEGIVDERTRITIL